MERRWANLFVPCLASDVGRCFDEPMSDLAAVKTFGSRMTDAQSMISTPWLTDLVLQSLMPYRKQWILDFGIVRKTR